MNGVRGTRDTQGYSKKGIAGPGLYYLGWQFVRHHERMGLTSLKVLGVLNWVSRDWNFGLWGQKVGSQGVVSTSVSPGTARKTWVLGSGAEKVGFLSSHPEKWVWGSKNGFEGGQAVHTPTVGISIGFIGTLGSGGVPTVLVAGAQKGVFSGGPGRVGFGLRGTKKWGFRVWGRKRGCFLLGFPPWISGLGLKSGFFHGFSIFGVFFGLQRGREYIDSSRN